MPFFLILGVFVPRIVLAALYLFTEWFSGVFTIWIWPVLGFILMPYTLLWYTVVVNWFGGTWGTVQIIVLVIAIALDIGAYDGFRR